MNNTIAASIAADAVVWAAARTDARRSIDHNAPTGPNPARASKNLGRLTTIVERHAELLAFSPAYDDAHPDFAHNLVKISRAASKAIAYGATTRQVENAAAAGLANARLRVAFAPAKVSLTKA